MIPDDDQRKVVILSSRAFDNAYYLSQAVASGLPDLWEHRSLIDHYLASGWKHSLSPSADFNITAYLAANPDIRQAGVEPLSHFLVTGRHEGRAVGQPESEFPRGIAFYLPQFHPDPRNEQWWGKGFTDWANVTRAHPMFEGHNQPILPGELGFYDLRLRESQEAQAALANEFGLAGFCLHYYWFDGVRVLDAPLRNILANPAMKFPFCLCWANENWTRRWDGMDHEILLAQNHNPRSDYKFIYDILPALLDDRYLKVAGHPILLVYRPDLLREPAHTAALWREVAVQEGLPGLFLGAVNFRVDDPRPFGFDALVEFPPHHFPAEELGAAEKDALGAPTTLTIRNYASGVSRSVGCQPAREFAVLPAVMPGWDNTARRMEHAVVFAGSTPGLFRLWTTAQMLRAADQLRPCDRMVFINAWNEWAEGAVLEPRRDLGRAFLSAFRAAKAAIQCVLSGGEADVFVQLVRWLQQIDETVQSGRQPVIVVLHDAERAGAQILLLQLLSSLQRHKVAIDPFLVLLGDGPLAGEFAAIGPTLRAASFVDAGVSRDETTELIVAGLAPRISLPLLCNTVMTSAFAAQATKAKLKTILYVHEMPASIEMYVGSEAFLASARCCQRIITVSNFAKHALASKFPELQSRIEVIRAGVPNYGAPDSASDDANLLRRLHIDPTRPIVLGCGAIHPRKGVDLYPALAQAVLREQPDVQFLWCGGVQSDPDYLRWIEYDLRARGLEGRLRFLGILDDVGPLYRAAQAFVLLSREDPFPLVVLEAARAALPVLAFEGAGGAVELLDGLDELRVPYANVDCMAGQLCAILRDGDLRRYLGASLQYRARTITDWDTYTGRMLDRLLGGVIEDVPRSRNIATASTCGSDLPRVSVVIPFYNHGQFIAETLDSLACQTWPAHEIIIIDDGSRDADREAAKSAAAKLPTARFHSRPNCGAHATINEACADATGEFVTILNSDDVYHPRRLEQLVTAARLRPTIGLFATEIAFIDEQGTNFDQGAWYRDGWERIDGGGPIWLALLRSNVLLTTSNLFFRAAFLRKVGSLRPFRYAHDLDILQRSLFVGEVGLIRSQLLSYRFHSGNTIRENLQAARLECAQIVAEAWYSRCAVDGYDASVAAYIARTVHEEVLQAAYAVFADALERDAAVQFGHYAQLCDALVGERARAALAAFDRGVGDAEYKLRISPHDAARSVIQQGGWLAAAVLTLGKHRELEKSSSGFDSGSTLSHEGDLIPLSPAAR